MSCCLYSSSRIETLDVLRCFAFIGVLLSHANPSFGILGGCSISMFLIISGFSFTYSYYNKNRIVATSLKEAFHFAVSKVKKFYPIHIICTILMMFFPIIGETKIPIIKWIIIVVFNILLLNSWLPFYDHSLNGSSWYLSAYFFCCLLFPFILKRIEKKNTLKYATINISACLSAQLLIGLIGQKLPVTQFSYADWLSYDIPKWFIYYFPPARVVDFMIGCNLFILYKKTNKQFSKCKCTLLEAISICIVLVELIFTNKFYVLDKSEFPMGYTENWWTYVLVFTFGSIMMIYFFAIGNGYISRIVTNKVTKYIANVSTYGFLIHLVVFYYLQAIIKRVPFFDGGNILFNYGTLIYIFFGGIITVLLVHLWNRLFQKPIK